MVGGGLMRRAMQETRPSLKPDGAPRFSLMFGGFRSWKGQRLIGF